MSNVPVPVNPKALIERAGERPKDTICELNERLTGTRKKKPSEGTMEGTKVVAEQPGSPRDKSDPKSPTSGKPFMVQQMDSIKGKQHVQNTGEVEKSEIISGEIATATLIVLRGAQMESPGDAKHVRDVKPNAFPKIVEEKRSVVDTKTDKNTCRLKAIPVIEKDSLSNAWSAAVPRTRAPISTPDLNQRPLVLATHLVPSLPIGLFEVLAEVFEVVAKRPVVLLHETRPGRPVAKDIVDIAILPAVDEWRDGVLLPASFVFEHRLNKNNSPCVYADVIVADRAAHVGDIMDLRGHRCAVPDRRNQLSAAGLLFKHLRTRGESPAFFGNTLDASSQLAALQMVAGKQAEVGVLEGPVIRCQRFSVPGVESLHVLTSLGPLPPYRIMINRMITDKLAKQFVTYLLSINQHEEWMERLSPFGIIGFAENSKDYYDLGDMKSVITSVPYY